MQGFLTLNCIVGGQALAGISDNLTDTTGIVIISLISLVVSQYPGPPRVCIDPIYYRLPFVDTAFSIGGPFSHE